LDRKIRVGAVSYLNTIPLLFGIRNSRLIREIDLLIDYPSRIASFLLEDKIDIGLVPVAVIPRMKEFYLNTQYCIGSEGPVASVCLFSERPIQNVKTVLMDYQSTTSVELTKILLREYWKIEPDLLDTREDFRHLIREETAGLIIGDRALEQRRI
jgi:chorismate dehydratase